MKDLLRLLNQKPIAYYPIYRQIAGSTTAGILLSQLMYWFSKKDKIYKTDKEIMEETLLSKKELETAKKRIKQLDFILITREGIPAKTYYSIDWEMYENAINEYSTKGGNYIPRKGETTFHERGKLHSTKGGNLTPRKGETITENTTKTTTKITTKSNIKKEIYKEKNNFDLQELNEKNLENNYTLQTLLKELNISISDVKRVVVYRKILKKPLRTMRGLIGLIRAIKNTMNETGKSFEEVFEIMQENEWQSIKPEYLLKKQNKSEEREFTPEELAQFGIKFEDNVIDVDEIEDKGDKDV